MELVFQFGIILGITFAAEIIHNIIPLPIPASIYGLLIMLICLYTKLIKLDQIKKAGYFLLEIMPLMFIPAAVGLITIVADMKTSLLAILVITVISTVVVMGVTGSITQAIIRGRTHNKK